MNRITTLVVGPVDPKHNDLAELFLKEYLTGGENLMRNPRRVRQYYDLSPWKEVWEMEVGSNALPISLTVVRAKRPGAVTDPQGVMRVQFSNMRKSVKIECDGGNDCNCVARISCHVKPARIPGIANQLNADYVVNGKAEEQIAIGKKAAENEKLRKAAWRAKRLERKREEARHRPYFQ